MIISHKHKYIFIKAVKVGGTSVELNLAKSCGADDIVTPLDEASEKKDTDLYSQPARNYDGFFGHDPLEEIKTKVGLDIWNNYFKFTIVRNPWDTIVSMYCWLKTSKEMRFSQISNHNKVLANILNPRAYAFVISELAASAKHKISKNFMPNDFDFFIKHMDELNQTNKRYYFDSNGSAPCDAYLRYETLEKDYRKVCERLRIPYEKLPKTKNKSRTNRIHYSQYYNEESKQFVREKCKEEIAYFGYAFENKN